MKKYRYVIIFAFAFLFFGCKNNNVNSSSSEVSVNDSNESISEIDREIQRQIMDELNKDITNFEEKLEGLNQIVYLIDISVGKEEYNQKIFVQQDPIYIETMNDNSSVVMAVVDNKMYLYVPYNNNYFERMYLGEYSDLDGTLDTGIEVDELINNPFDIDKFVFQKKDNLYLMTALYQDYLGKANVDLLKETYELYNVDVDKIMNSIVTTSFEFDSKLMKVTMSFKIDGQYENGKKEELDISVSIKILIDDFRLLNIYNKKFIVPPQSPDTVTETTKIEEVNSAFPGRIACYRVALEKGVLVHNLADKNINFALFNYELEDATNTYDFPDWPFINDKDKYNMIDIPEDGIYYIGLYTNNLYTDLSFKNFKNDDSSTSQNLINEVKTLSFDNKYDFYSFKVEDSEIKGKVKITNNSEYGLFVFDKKWKSYVYPNQSYYINIYDKDFYIFLDYANLDENQKALCEVEFTIFPFGINDLPPVVEIEDNSKILISEDQDELMFYSYFEKGSYLYDYSYNMYTMYFFDENGNQLDLNLLKDGNPGNFEKTFIIPEDGYYFIYTDRLASYDFIELTKNDYKTIIDKNNPNALNYDDAINYGTIEGYLDFENYVVKNDADEIKIYEIENVGDEQLYVFVQPYYDTTYRMINISPDEKGYFTLTNNSEKILFICNDPKNKEAGAIDYKFKIRNIESNVNTNMSNIDELEELTMEYREKTYFLGYGISEHYMKIVINETCDIDIVDSNNRANYVIYSLQGELVNSGSYSNCILEPGTYIVKLYMNDHVYEYTKYKYVLREN